MLGGRRREVQSLSRAYSIQILNRTHLSSISFVSKTYRKFVGKTSKFNQLLVKFVLYIFFTASDVLQRPTRYMYRIATSKTPMYRLRVFMLRVSMLYKLHKPLHNTTQNWAQCKGTKRTEYCMEISR